MCIFKYIFFVYNHNKKKKKINVNAVSELQWLAEKIPQIFSIERNMVQFHIKI